MTCESSNADLKRTSIETLSVMLSKDPNCYHQISRYVDEEIIYVIENKVNNGHLAKINYDGIIEFPSGLIPKKNLNIDQETTKVAKS